MMFSSRGDAHNLYLLLKKTAEHNKDVSQLKEIMEIKEIQKFYQSIDLSTLRHIYYRLLKEKGGSGSILILVSALPWLLLLFSSQLQKHLFENGTFLWLVFTVIYLSIIIVSVIIHFREKAWANVHIEIIRDLLSEK